MPIIIYMARLLRFYFVHIKSNGELIIFAEHFDELS